MFKKKVWKKVWNQVTGNKGILLLFLGLVCPTLSIQSGPGAHETGIEGGEKTEEISIPKPDKKDSLLFFAYRYIGTPYKYAGTSPKGFDCSGFVFYVFKNHGVEIPRTSRDMGRLGREVPRDSAKKGDVILFLGTNASNKTIGHAGIVCGADADDLQFIHSSSNRKSGGVILSCMKDSPYYQKRFVKIVRFEM